MSDESRPDRTPGQSQPGDQGPAEDTPSEGRPSGLRNPAAAVRGVGAAGLAVEALVLLLAIQPMRVLGVHLTGAAIGTIIGLAVVCLALCGVLRKTWAWYAGFVVQVVLIAAGFVFHASLAIVGVLFLLLWTYIVSVRRTVLGKH